MSVFRVKLQNRNQGTLDRGPSGLQNTVSIQRTAYVVSPTGSMRLFNDGEEFTDSNYYKRFCYPQVPLEEAMLELVSDDGSIYSEIRSENTYPKVYNLDVVNSTTYTATANIADIATDTGSYATFAQISNNGDGTVQCKINDTAIIDIGGGNTQVFNTGDLQITKLAFANASGGDCDVQVLLSIRN